MFFHERNEYTGGKLFLFRKKRIGVVVFLSPEERIQTGVVFVRRGKNTGVGGIVFSVGGKNKEGAFLTCCVKSLNVLVVLS